MTTYNSVVSSKTLVTDAAINSLANNTYVSCGVINVSAAVPVDIILEVSATAGASVASLERLSVFARLSLDGTNYSTGPVSGTTATREPNLIYVGFLPLKAASTLERKQFSLLYTIGAIAPHIEIVVRNETGVALAASGHSVHYSTVVGNATA